MDKGGITILDVRSIENLTFAGMGLWRTSVGPPVKKPYPLIRRSRVRGFKGKNELVE